MKKEDFVLFNEFMRGTFSKEGKSAEDILHACQTMLPGTGRSPESAGKAGKPCSRCRGRGWVEGGYISDGEEVETGGETCPACNGEKV